MKAIRQTITFEASPHEIYEMLMDSKKHSDFTGSTAKISREVGGKFTVWGGDISGENMELVKDRKIVQKWRSGDWPEGHFSTAAFELKADGKKTRLTLTQTDVPNDKYESIKQGWIDFYWDNMKAALKKS
jgi:activator of HSP90 ATPase